MRSAFMDHLVNTGLVERELVEQAARKNPQAEYVGQLALLHGVLGGAEIDKILSAQQQDRKMFGQLAMQMGLMDRRQLDVLLAGQALRGCIEILEDLALSQEIDINDGLRAISEFMSGKGFQEGVVGSA